MRKALCLIPAALAAAWGAEPAPLPEAPWLELALQRSLGIMEGLAQDRSLVLPALQFLGKPEPVENSAGDRAPAEMAPPAEGESVVLSDGGVLFDAEHRLVAYSDNVRVQDPRLKLHASQLLIVEFRKQQVDNAKEGVQDRIQRPDEAAAKSPATPDAPPEPEKKPTAEEPPTEAVTQFAFVSAERNQIYLQSTERIDLKRGDTELHVEPKDGQAALLADEAGNVTVTGGKISMSWVDKEGRPGSLMAEGTLYYHGAEHCVTSRGEVQMRTADGSLHCTESLCVFLSPAEEQEAPRDGFMSRLLGTRLDGVRHAVARGEVQLTMQGTDKRGTVDARGQELVYRAEPGTVELRRNCSLCYGGESTVFADESICLQPNGDLLLRGEVVHGSYVRPGKEGQQPAPGSFRAAGPLVFTAADGCIRAEEGFYMKDAAGTFRCLGAAVLTLRPGAQKVPPRAEVGNLNLALLGYGDPVRLHAVQEVQADYADPESGDTGCLRGEEMAADLEAGTLRVRSLPGKAAVAAYRGARAEAVSDAAESVIDCAQSGDVHLTGDRITMRMPQEQGESVFTCTESAVLTRADRTFVGGPLSELHAPQAIVTSRGKITLHLAEGEAKPARSQQQVAAANFNYVGVESVATDEGCTARTSRGSMQCEGKVRMTLNPRPAKDDEWGGLLTLRAEDRVAVAGRSGDGRLLRGTGDLLVADAATGTKRLSGHRVTLSDGNNTHVASGAGAAVVLDNKNNARVFGAVQQTVSTRIHEQIEKNKQKKEQ